MERERILQLIKAVYAAQEEEIGCSQFFERLPEYVDRVIAAGSGPLPQDAMPEVRHHIGQCPECAEAYEVLLEVTRSAG